MINYAHRSYRKNLKFKKVGLWCLGIYVAFGAIFLTWCLAGSLIGK
jgi:hypothetical protein